MFLLFHIAGGGRLGGTFYDEIYKYEDGVWSLVGNMKTKRQAHAVSVVRKEDVIKNCQ